MGTFCLAPPQERYLTKLIVPNDCDLEIKIRENKTFLAIIIHLLKLCKETGVLFSLLTLILHIMQLFLFQNTKNEASTNPGI